MVHWRKQCRALQHYSSPKIVVLLSVLVTSSSYTWCVYVCVCGRECTPVCICCNTTEEKKGTLMWAVFYFTVINHQRITWLSQLSIRFHKNISFSATWAASHTWKPSETWPQHCCWLSQTPTLALLTMHLSGQILRGGTSQTHKIWGKITGVRNRSAPVRPTNMRNRQWWNVREALN